jgi:hypothetical protein
MCRCSGFMRAALSSSERFRQAYAFVAQECQVPGYDDPKADMLVVKKWLEQQGIGRWLVVIDSADDTQLFIGRPHETTTARTSSHEEKLGFYIPECAHGSILVTTRNKQTGSRLAKGNHLIEVEKMDQGESYQLLRAEIRDFNLEETHQSFLRDWNTSHLPLFKQQHSYAKTVYRLVNISNSWTRATGTL